MHMTPGARLGPYLIERLLGSGGMGDVYRARDTRLHRAVAIKALHDPAGDASAHRIMLEARAAARLNHPNIATLHDVIEQDGALFLVMELVEGDPLKDRIAEGPLPLDTALDVGRQIADALAYAHGEGVVHRDVKPGNILITRDGRVKLLDLGIAQAAGSDPADATRTGTAEHISGTRQGTPAYMSPEQIAGRAAGFPSDVYSTGVVLYEMLTGRRPFDAPDLIGFAAVIAAGPVPRPSAINHTVPAAVDAVLVRALAPAPHDRFQTAGHLRDALVQARSGSASRRPAWRRPWVLAAVSTAAALAIWAAAAGWFQTRAPGPIAVLPALNATEDPELDSLGTIIITAVAGNLAVTPGATMVSANPAAYRVMGRDAFAAAASLNARYVVDLRMQKAGDQPRAVLRLVEASRTVPLWDGVFEGDAFDVVRAVVERVGDVLDARGALARTLTPLERETLRRLPVQDAGAFRAYLRGRVLLDHAPGRAEAEGAAAAFEEAAAHETTSALAHASLSQAQILLFNLTRDQAWADKAAASSRRALELDPARAPVQDAAARTAQAAGELEAAERHAREAIRLAPDLDTVYRMLAGILSARHDPQGAIDASRSAATLRPDSAQNQYALGYYCYAAGQFQEAVEPLRRAVALRPDSPVYFTTLGSAYHNIGDVEQAIGNYAQALRLGANAQAHSNLGTAYYYAGRFDEAVSNYRQALALDSSSATTHRNLADAYERMGRRTEAHGEYIAAIGLADARLEANPQDVQQMALKAFAEAKIGRDDAAQRDIAAALTLSRRTNADVLFKSAQIQALAGRTDAAFRDLGEALSLGYSVVFARDDWDLRSLRSDERFTQLVNRQP